MILKEEQCKIGCFHWFNSIASLQTVYSEFSQRMSKQFEFSDSDLNFRDRDVLILFITNNVKKILVEEMVQKIFWNKRF